MRTFPIAHRPLIFLSLIFLSSAFVPLRAAEIECDLLVVGGAEGGVAAAVQAWRG